MSKTEWRVKVSILGLTAPHTKEKEFVIEEKEKEKPLCRVESL